MNIALLLTCYNRPEYLKPCLDSLNEADLSQVSIYVVDDGSIDPQVKELLKYFAGTKVFQANKGIRKTLLHCYDWLFEEHDIVINLDSDTVVKPDFIERLLTLHNDYPWSIITGFNTYTANRHKVIKEDADCTFRRSCGGVNLLLTKALYYQFVRNALETETQHWDWELFKTCQHVVCTKPSVIQHIGFNSTLGHNGNIDLADQFDFDLSPFRKSETYVFNQFKGLGDILFLIPIARSYIEQGHKVIWPIIPEYLPIQKHFPDIQFLDKTKYDFPYDCSYRVQMPYGHLMPFRFSDRFGLINCMRAKYDMVSLPLDYWRTLTWKRDLTSEHNLAYHVNATGRYQLVNRYFRDTSETLEITPELNPDLPIIEMTNILGYTLLDWCTVIEQAAEIHTANTALLYILEVLPLKMPIHFYKRNLWGEKAYEFTDYLYSKNYILH